jgi:hypothetical protein
LGKDALEHEQIMKLVDKAGLKRSVSGFGNCYEMLVKEFIVNIPKDCDNPLSTEYIKVFVRGKCVEFSPEIINRVLSRSEEEHAKVEITDNDICKEITANQVKKWPIKGKLASSKLSVKYVVLHKVRVANWVPTTSTFATGLGRFIYIVGTKTNFNFGSYVFEQTMKHAQTFAIKMLIAFPSLICAIIQNQHLGILVSSNVASKRESPLTFLYKLLTGSHVPDIVLASEQEAASSTTKEGILAELQEMSKTMEETIWSSTERKASVDKMIMSLSAQASMDADKENL